MVAVAFDYLLLMQVKEELPEMQIADAVGIFSRQRVSLQL